MNPSTLDPSLMPIRPADAMIDPAAVKRLRMMLGDDDKVILPNLIEMLARDFEELSGEAFVAIEQNKTADLHRAAHTMKSNSANFGITRMTQLCAELELRAKNGIMEEASEYLIRIRQEYEKAKPELEALRGSISSS